MKTNIIILLSIALLQFSCDVIKKDQIEKSNVVAAKKKVFLEYFTGHFCGNCPSQSHAALSDIENAYGSDVIVMTIHAGFFATPNLLPDKLNLTTTEGTKMATDAGLTSVPIGRINRKAYNNSMLVSTTEWLSAVSKNTTGQSMFELSLSGSFSSTDSVINATLNVKSLAAITGKFNVNSYLTEDSIIGYQLDYTKTPNEVPNYIFMHVLRSALNSSNQQDQLNDNSFIAENTTIEKKFTTQAKGKKWKIKNCSIITIISDQETGEVIQVEKLNQLN